MVLLPSRACIGGTVCASAMQGLRLSLRLSAGVRTGMGPCMCLGVNPRMQGMC